MYMRIHRLISIATRRSKTSHIHIINFSPTPTPHATHPPTQQAYFAEPGAKQRVYNLLCIPVFSAYINYFSIVFQARSLSCRCVACMLALDEIV